MSNSNTQGQQDVERNISGHRPEDERPSVRTVLANIIEDFSFLWFTLSMNTGILSILLHQNPYQFNGLRLLSTIMFVFNIVLFTLFFTILVVRLVVYPQAVIKSCVSNATELSLTGAVPIALFTLAAQVGLTVSHASWGGHAFTVVAYIMWWLGTVVMLIISVLVFVVTAKTNVIELATLSPGIVVPFVGTTTDAVVGALIVGYSADVSAGLAIPVIIVSYLLVGVGFWVAMMIYSAYFAKIISHGLPPPAQSPSLVLLTGPCGQSAAAVLLLGHAAKVHFASYGKGTIFQATAGVIFDTVGVLLSLTFIGLGIFLILFALYVIMEVAWRKEHRYSLLWWSTIFPLATYNTAWISLAEELDSPTFRVLSTIFLLLLLLDYFINWGFTIRDIYQGKLLSGRRHVAPANGRVKGN